MIKVVVVLYDIYRVRLMPRSHILALTDFTSVCPYWRAILKEGSRRCRRCIRRHFKTKVRSSFTCAHIFYLCDEVSIGNSCARRCGNRSRLCQVMIPCVLDKNKHTISQLPLIREKSAWLLVIRT
jgi:hypothetical protein